MYKMPKQECKNGMICSIMFPAIIFVAPWMFGCLSVIIGIASSSHMPSLWEMWTEGFIIGKRGGFPSIWATVAIIVGFGWMFVHHAINYFKAAN